MTFCVRHLQHREKNRYDLSYRIILVSLIDRFIQFRTTPRETLPSYCIDLWDEKYEAWGYRAFYSKKERSHRLKSGDVVKQKESLSNVLLLSQKMTNYIHTYIYTHMYIYIYMQTLVPWLWIYIYIERLRLLTGQILQDQCQQRINFFLSFVVTVLYFKGTTKNKEKGRSIDNSTSTGILIRFLTVHLYPNIS